MDPVTPTKVVAKSKAQAATPGRITRARSATPGQHDPVAQAQPPPVPPLPSFKSDSLSPPPDADPPTPTREYVDVLADWNARGRSADPIFCSEQRCRAIEREIDREIQPYSHAPQITFPIIVEPFGLQRWVPSRDRPPPPEGISGPTCHVANEAKPMCHQYAIPAFLYTSPSQICAKATENHQPTLIWKFALSDKDDKLRLHSCLHCSSTASKRCSLKNRKLARVEVDAERSTIPATQVSKTPATQVSRTPATQGNHNGVPNLKASKITPGNIQNVVPGKRGQSVLQLPLLVEKRARTAQPDVFSVDPKNVMDPLAIVDPRARAASVPSAAGVDPPFIARAASDSSANVASGPPITAHSGQSAQPNASNDPLVPSGLRKGRTYWLNLGKDPLLTSVTPSGPGMTKPSEQVPPPPPKKAPAEKFVSEGMQAQVNLNGDPTAADGLASLRESLDRSIHIPLSRLRGIVDLVEKETTDASKTLDEVFERTQKVWLAGERERQLALVARQEADHTALLLHNIDARLRDYVAENERLRMDVNELKAKNAKSLEDLQIKDRQQKAIDQRLAFAVEERKKLTAERDEAIKDRDNYKSQIAAADYSRVIAEQALQKAHSAMQDAFAEADEATEKLRAFEEASRNVNQGDSVIRRPNEAPSPSAPQSGLLPQPAETTVLPTAHTRAAPISNASAGNVFAKSGTIHSTLVGPMVANDLQDAEDGGLRDFGATHSRMDHFAVGTQAEITQTMPALDSGSAPHGFDSHPSQHGVLSDFPTFPGGLNFLDQPSI